MLLSRSLVFTITLVLIQTVVVVAVNINFLPEAERNTLLILLAVPAVLAVILLVLPAVLAVLLLVLLVLLTSQSYLCFEQKCENKLFFSREEKNRCILHRRVFVMGQSSI